MMNNGMLVTNEYSSSRVKVLAANLNRCGVYNAAVSHFDGDVFGEWLPNTFDYVLLDAPCSGEGSLRKDPRRIEKLECRTHSQHCRCAILLDTKRL